MNPDCSDQTLARFFDRQRNADLSALPAFARVSSAAPGRRRAPRRVIGVALGSTALLLVTLSWLRLTTPETPPAAERANAMVSWQPATDALLPALPESLASTSPLGGAWTDALLPRAQPNARTEDSPTPSKS